MNDWPSIRTLRSLYFVRMLQGHTLPMSAEAREGLHHDIWIAALCLQHKLPLLSNDRDMRRMSGLELIGW